MKMYVLLILGFVLLIKGADYFVEASSSIAKRLRIPSIIIGLTVVAMGTSAPELAVSATASLAGNNDIAVGNIIGSNLFNLLMVLGTCGLIRPFAVKLRWDYLVSVGVTILLFFLMVFDGTVGRIDGFLLLSLFVVFLLLTIRDALANRITSTEGITALPVYLAVLFIGGGLAAIVWGGNLVVNNAKAIAQSFGLSQTLVGLTIVALGTSLPELVTSIVASRKGENGLAVGNVIGSNIFNLLLVLGTTSAISPITVNHLSLYDTAFLIIASGITWFLCKTKNQISRLEGSFLLIMYFGYMIYITLR